MERLLAHRSSRPLQRSPSRAELLPEEDFPSARAGSGGSPTPDEKSLFGRLQATAGNRAVMAMVQREPRTPAADRRPVVQRAPEEFGTDWAVRKAVEKQAGGMTMSLLTFVVAEWAKEAVERAGTAKPKSSATAAATGHATLRKGSRGPAVVELQGRLNERGAEPQLKADGIFGSLTREAVVAYQSGHDLKPDGIVGPLTWSSLTAAQPDIPPSVDPLEGLPVEVVGHGASEPAVAAARKAAIELFGDLRDPSRAQLLTTKVALDVIPHDKQLTDLPEYKHLKGTKTFDGRIWDTVRGIQTDIGGVHRFAIAEEDLVSVSGKAASYGEGFLAAHEGGHALQASSLTPDQLKTLTTLHSTRLAASGPITQTTVAGTATAMWLNPAWYSAANKEEYFANSVAAYLGHPYSNKDEDKLMYNRAWLAAKDPGMFALLQSVFKQ